MPIVTVKNKYQVVIPMVLRKQIGVDIGDLMEARVERGKITFTHQTLFDRELAESVAESVADYKAGRHFGPFDNHKDFIASLHREMKKIKNKKAKA